MAIDTLFLDAGGVLVGPDWERIARIFAEHGVVVDADELRRVEPTVHRELDDAYGQIRTADEARRYPLFERCAQLAGAVDVPREAILAIDRAHVARNHWRHVYPEVRPALTRLRQRFAKMVVVSNANGTVQELFDELDLTRFFDVIVDSGAVGIEKPDPRIFALALDRAGSTADRTVHVGDYVNIDVVGARSAGIRPILVDRTGTIAGIDVIRDLGELEL